MLGLYVNRVRWIDETPRRQANKHVSSWLGTQELSLHSKSLREHANRVRLQAPYKQALATYYNPLKEAGLLWEVVALIIAVFHTWSLGPCSLTPVSLSCSLSFLLPILPVLSSSSDQLVCFSSWMLRVSEVLLCSVPFFFSFSVGSYFAVQRDTIIYTLHSLVWLSSKVLTLSNMVICFPPSIKKGNLTSRQTPHVFIWYLIEEEPYANIHSLLINPLAKHFFLNVAVDTAPLKEKIYLSHFQMD